MSMKHVLAAFALLGLTAAPVLAQTTKPAITTAAPVAVMPAKPVTPVTPTPAAVTTPAAKPAATAPATPATGKTNLNTATAAQIDALPTIGKARTKAILTERDKGKFADWPDFDKRMTGTSVNAGVKAKIKDLVTF